MLFDAKSVRLAFEKWALDSALSTVYEEGRPMGNISAHLVNDVISASLVGLNKEIEPVIDRSLAWLDRAISEDEDFGTSRNFHRQTLHWARALGLWAPHGSIDIQAWNNARHFCGLTLSESDVWGKQASTAGLDDYMALCILAGQHALAVAEYEKFHGKKAVNKRGTKPRDYAYAYCLLRTGEDIDGNVLAGLGKQMLKANLEREWFGGGQYTRGATWILIVNLDEFGSLKPYETIRKCYEYMPNVERPSFL